jgi:hypothetical protein
VLLAFFATVQVTLLTFILLALFAPVVDRQIPFQVGAGYNKNVSWNESITSTLWNLNGTMCLVGFVGVLILIASIVTWRTVRNVDLIGVMRYLWVLVWLLPFELFCAIGLFDYFEVTAVWIKHWWRSPEMAWFRSRYCVPASTYNSRCTVPLGVNGTRWCEVNYQANDCVKIRDAAQASANHGLYFLYYFSGAWAVCMFVLLSLTIHTLERIISKPLVQKSRESNVPAWLSLPIIGRTLVGIAFAFSQQSVLNYDTFWTLGWMGPLYIATGGLFFIAAAVSCYISRVPILSTNDKRRKMLAIYMFIASLVTAFLCLCILFGTSIAFSASLPDQVRAGDEEI